MTQVVSSISGLQVYAPSAGYAPTNSADVSAIASGYQVVSSTATQLYAGTAYLTSVNDAPVSASRAGNATNAGMANSAYYDGTGRLISSLPDSAAVSAIASSYAESAASGKQDTMTFAYDDDKISAINGSALAGQGGVTGDYVEKSALEVSIGSANYIMSATSYAQQQASGNVLIQGKGNSAFGASLAQGRFNSATYSSFSQGNANNATGFSLAQGSGNKAYAGSFAQGYGNSASGYSVAQGHHNSAYNYSVAIGYYNSATDFATAFGINNLLGNGSTATGDSVALVIGDGHSNYSRHDLMVVTKDGEITMYSSTADTTGTGIMSSIRAISAAATGGGVDSAAVSAIASSYAESAASGKLDSSAIGTAEWMMVPMVTSISGAQISAITAAHAEGADSAHTDTDGRYLTALAAESSLSSKLDSSASSSFYTTANESGFITGVDLTPYQTTAGMTAYQPAGDYQPSGDYYSASNPSGFVDSAYVDSAVSGKQDALTFAYDADSAISAINGSALAGQGGGASIPFTGKYWDSATSATAAITADVTAVSSLAYTRHNGNVVNTYKGITDSLGIHHLGVASFIDAGAEINGKSNGMLYTMSFAPPASMWTTADAATGIFAPLRYGSGAGMFLDNSSYKGYLKGNEWFVANTDFGYARGEVHPQRGCQVIVTHTGGAEAVLSAKNNGANVRLYNTSYGTAHMAAGNSQAYVQVQRGNIDSKYNSAKLDTDYLKFWNGMATGYLDPEDTASGTSYMPPETEYIYISSIPYWNGKADGSALSSYVPYSSLEYNTASAISGINGSALAAGSTYSAGEGIDITDDVISVEAPVDIVAGPGIVIDNPDGNTLRVSVAQAEEVELFSGTAANTNVVLNETLDNFERIKIYAYWKGTNTYDYYGYSVTEIYTSQLSAGKRFTVNVFCNLNDSEFYSIANFSVASTKTQLNLVNVKRASLTEQLIAQNDGPTVYKVVGIHRIANN